jgi:hypothetical protein
MNSPAGATRITGFRRVHGVHLRVVSGRVSARATGVLHRYPHTVPISLATARRLIASGVPLHVDQPLGKQVVNQ